MEETAKYQKAAEQIRGSLDDAGCGHLDVRIVRIVRKAAGLEAQAVRAPVSGEEPSYLEPPLPIAGLFTLVLRSAALRPNIDAYATNIHGFGHRIKPRFGDDDVKAAIEREIKRDKTETPDAEIEKVVEARLEKWRAEAEAERAELARFFEYATVGMSFVSLRKRTCFDLESCGNAYWEVARGPFKQGEDGEDIEGSDLLSGKIYHAPAKYMRVYPAKDELTVDQHEQHDALTWHDSPVRRRFRHFACVAGDGMVERHLKEFGDPRVMSSRTGSYFVTVEELKAKEGSDAVAANEVAHFSIYSGDLGYGQPRWCGAMLEVSGSIAVGEVNFLFFDEGGGVPKFAILVSGAKLHSGDAQAAEEVLKEHKAKGIEGFHDALVFEAVPAQGGMATALPKVDIKTLRGDGGGDLTYGAYDERNMEKVGSQFRIPPILRGVIRDINRATAFAALDFAETQIFAGERTDFDWYMNRVFLVEARIKWNEFVSLGPQVNDLEATAAALSALSRFIIPREGRRYITDKTTFDLEDLDPEKEEWTLRPLEVTLAGRGYDMTPAGEKRGSAPWLKGRHAPRPHEIIADEEDESGSGKPE